MRLSPSDDVHAPTGADSSTNDIKCQSPRDYETSTELSPPPDSREDSHISQGGTPPHTIAGTIQSTPVPDSEENSRFGSPPPQDDKSAVEQFSMPEADEDAMSVSSSSAENESVTESRRSSAIDEDSRSKSTVLQQAREEQDNSSVTASPSHETKEASPTNSAGKFSLPTPKRRIERTYSNTKAKGGAIKGDKHANPKREMRGRTKGEPRHHWSPHEDALLLRLHAGGKTWEQMATRIKGRTGLACSMRYRALDGRRSHEQKPGGHRTRKGS